MFFEIQAKDNRLAETIRRKAHPHFERGINAAIGGHPLQSFEEYVETTKLYLLEHGFDEDFAEALACTFAKSYMAGIVAAVPQSEDVL